MPTSATASTASPAFSARPEMSVTPMMISISAASSRARWPDTTPRVSACTVRITRFSTGLAPGCSFSAPKTRKTTPTQMRSTSML